MSPDSAAIADSIDNPTRFAVIFDRHFNAIHGYLQRRVGRDLADELTAQTFLIAFDRRARYDPAWPSARPWLFGIATNLLRRQRRQERRQLRAYITTGMDPIADAFEGVEVRIDAGRMGRELAGALTRLSSEELDVLLLYAWAELSYTEIAQTLDIPVGTVRSRISRARRHIRELLEPERASTECKHSEKTEADDGRD